MKLSENSRSRPWLVLAASLLVSFGIWRWASAVFLPANTAAALQSGRPVGNNSDLYPRWLGAREALLHGRDPYSTEVTREIQTGFYGRPLNPNNPADPAGQEAFVYPLYVILLMAPTVTLPFPAVQEIFRWFLLFAIACSVPLWMAAIGWRPDIRLVISGMLLAASSYPAVLVFHMQNLAALVVFFLAAAADSLARGWQLLGGFLLALATIKPEISWLMILWFLLWAIGDWKQRNRVVWSFSATMVVLLIAAEAVSPHWMVRFVAAVRQYPSYGADPNVFLVFLPWWVADPIMAVVVGVLFVCCWRWRKSPPGSAEFGWSLAWVSTVTLAVLPKLAAYNQPLLIPALLVLLAEYGTTAKKSGLFSRATVKAAFACQIWQWAVAVILALCSFVVPATRLQKLALLPVDTLIALPPLTLLAVMLSTLSLRHPESGNETAS